MSLDISADTPPCPHCGRGNVVLDENITYNVAPIYYPTMRAVGIRGGLRGLDGMRLGDVPAAEALAFVDRHIKRFREREPKNGWGWGGVRCVYRVLHAIQDAQRNHPDAIINVC
jgi:hypothetical protein